MIRNGLLIALLVWLMPVYLALAQAPAETPQPYHLVRALQMLQNQIAEGSRAAYDAQPQLVAQIALALSRTDASDWKDRRNVQAMASFLFSGGPADPARRLLVGTAIQDRFDARLVKGALAYVEGRTGDARRLLDPIDPLVYSHSVGGQLALVQATLSAVQDPSRAMGVLDMARLLSPGTLVEESALRRQIFIAEDVKDAARFSTLVATYMTRFPASIYVKSVRSRLAGAAVNFAVTLPAEIALPIIVEILAPLEPSERCAALLGIAKQALITGRLALALETAQHARRLATPESGNLARADAYIAAAQSVSRAPEMSLAAMAAIDKTALPADDRDLLDVAQSAARQIAKAGAGPRHPPAGVTVGEPASALIEDSRTALRAADALLRGANR